MRSHTNRYKPNGVTFSGDWERNIITGDGTWGWSEIAYADRFTVVSDPTPRQGAYCARVDLQFGDDPKGDGTSRCEVSLTKSFNAKNIYIGEHTKEQYVGFSVMLDASWVAPDGAGDRWTLVAQLHGPDAIGASPILAFRAMSTFSIELRVGDDSDGSNTWPVYSLSDNALERGHWIDFILYFRFDRTNGLIRIWRRDDTDQLFAEVATISQHDYYPGLPTLQWMPDSTIPEASYWKHGIYRNPTCTVEHLCWLDGFTIGKTFADVERAISRRA